MSELAKVADKEMVYVPFGEKREVKLTIATVKRYVAVKTKSGKVPTDDDIVKFMMLCQARELNPFVGDAYLVGYDAKDGPKYSLITAHQGLLKRAEANSDFDGLESGVIVRRRTRAEKSSMVDEGDAYTMETLELEGEWFDDGDILLGGWCRVFRKNLRKPHYRRVKFTVYNTNQSRWGKDPGGMITKVAEGAALRRAFPNQLGSMYTAAEMDHVVEGALHGEPSQADIPPQSLNDLIPSQSAEETAQTDIDEAVQPEPEPAPEDSPLIDKTTEEQPAQEDKAAARVEEDGTSKAYKAILERIKKCPTVEECTAIGKEAAIEIRLTNDERASLVYWVGYRNKQIEEAKEGGE